MVSSLRRNFSQQITMNENEYIAGIARQQLDKGLAVVLVSIMSLQGSTPRHSGTKMLAAADGKSYGTIGGSLIEATAVAESRKVINAGQSKIIEFDLTGKGTGSAGMICGGKAEILLDYLPATTESREFASQWHDAASHGKDVYLLTQLKGSGKTFQVLGHALLYHDGSISGNSSLTAGAAESLKSELHNISTADTVPYQDTRVFIERIRKIKTMYCFGAGHVAVPTAHLAALVGFRVVVIDDRAEYANAERFPDASKVIVTPDFNKAFDGLEIDADSFIVILTRGHQYDREVLEQAVKTSAGYIGMISSRRKKQAIYEALMSGGVKQEVLEKVHSPIGLEIGGETPEEIAVSIIAELISERSK
jgi:xanthine dehydrogenase accessory factor